MTASRSPCAPSLAVFHIVQVHQRQITRYHHAVTHCDSSWTSIRYFYHSLLKAGKFFDDTKASTITNNYHPSLPFDVHLQHLLISLQAFMDRYGALLSSGGADPNTVAGRELHEIVSARVCNNTSQCISVFSLSCFQLLDALALDGK